MVKTGWTADHSRRRTLNMKKTTIRKIISLLVFSAVFATTALAQIDSGQTSSRRYKNHRGSEKHPRKGKARGR